MIREVSNRLWCLPLAMVVCLTPGAPVRAEVPPGYEIIQITDDSQLDWVPRINSCGVVVWMRQLDGRRESAEIFTYDDATGQITRITDDNVRDVFPSINDDGTIVWARQIGPNDTFEIAMWRDGEMTILTDNAYDDTSATINNLGHVVWDGEAGSGCSEDEVFFFDGNQIERITRNNGFSNQSPRINDRDEIVWTGFDFCHNPWVGHILLYVDGEIVQLNEGTQQDQGNTINNVPQVAWDTGDRRIIIWDNGNRRELTDGISPRLNDLGEVAFIRYDPIQESWHEWLWRSGVVYELSSGSEWNTGGEINRRGELSWIRGIFPDTEIVLMRREKGDANSDGAIDLDDYQLALGCISGPGSQYADCECRVLDFDRDQDVDLQDFAAFQEVLNP